MYDNPMQVFMMITLVWRYIKKYFSMDLARKGYIWTIRLTGLIFAILNY
jgi:hypothetical protein